MITVKDVAKAHRICIGAQIKSICKECPFNGFHECYLNMKDLVTKALDSLILENDRLKRENDKLKRSENDYELE